MSVAWHDRRMWLRRSGETLVEGCTDKSKKYPGQFYSHNHGKAVSLTFKVEFARHFFQLGDASKVRGQMLDVAAIESLARFDEIQIMLLELSLLHRFLFRILVAELSGRTHLSEKEWGAQLSLVTTHACKQLAKPVVQLQMPIPEARLHISFPGGVEVEKDCVLTSVLEPVQKMLMSEQARCANSALLCGKGTTDSDRKCEISAKVGSLSARHVESSFSASSVSLVESASIRNWRKEQGHNR